MSRPYAFSPRLRAGLETTVLTCFMAQMQHSPRSCQYIQIHIHLLRWKSSQWVGKKPSLQAAREHPEQHTEPGRWNSLHHRNGTACKRMVYKNQFTSKTHRSQTSSVKSRLFNELSQSLKAMTLWVCSTEAISVRVSHGSRYSRVAFCAEKCTSAGLESISQSWGCSMVWNSSAFLHQCMVTYLHAQKTQQCFSQNYSKEPPQLQPQAAEYLHYSCDRGKGFKLWIFRAIKPRWCFVGGDKTS